MFFDPNLNKKRGRRARMSLSLLRTRRVPVLVGAWGYFKHGEITALLGLSGCGKSTLLNIF